MTSSFEEYIQIQNEYKNSLEKKYGKNQNTENYIKHAVDGSIKIFDALALRDIILENKPTKILEVGSFLGFSTRWILESTRSMNSHVVSLDPRVRHRVFDNLKDHLSLFTAKHAHRLSLVDAYLSDRNDSMFLHDYLYYPPYWKPREALSFLESIPVINQPFDVFDFAFIDGDHSFAATKLNVELVVRMMPKGGTIVVHDAISWPDVVPAIQEASKSSPIELEYVSGRELHSWMENHDVLGHEGAEKRFSLCDGLAIVRVSRK